MMRIVVQAVCFRLSSPISGIRLGGIKNSKRGDSPTWRQWILSVLSGRVFEN
jgi:hypothetical protein